MRFVCDHDVDAAVATTLRRLGHDAWTAANAGLSAASDDELTVYADNQDERQKLAGCRRTWSWRRRSSVYGFIAAEKTTYPSVSYTEFYRKR